MKCSGWGYGSGPPYVTNDRIRILFPFSMAAGVRRCNPLELGYTVVTYQLFFCFKRNGNLLVDTIGLQSPRLSMGDSFQIEWKSNERTYQLPDQPTNQLDDKSDFLIVSKHVFLRAGPRTLTNRKMEKVACESHTICYIYLWVAISNSLTLHFTIICHFYGDRIKLSMT